jgi:gluconolactonase
MCAATIHSYPSSSSLDEIVSRQSEIERVATGFQFVEGPVWERDRGSLLFSDIIGNAMYRWNEATGTEVVRKPSHMANGNTHDREGRLLTCEHATSCVSRTDTDGSYGIVVSHYEGMELNSPNDVVVKRDDSIWFTDPNSGRSEKYGIARPQQLGFQGVYRYDTTTKQLTLLIDDFSKPNGLCFSIDESVLYINDTDRQHIRTFDVMPDGSIRNGNVWATTDGNRPGVADGMKVDSQGNVYCCGSGGIHVFDPDGERIGVVTLPEVAANFTWGGPDLTILYITATHSVYRLRMQLPGHDPLAA